MKGLRILIIGTPICGWKSNEAPYFPDDILKDFIVLFLDRNVGRLQYGSRLAKYKRGDEATWSGCTDRRAPQAAWDVIELLLSLGADPYISLMGISAGVDRILSLVAYSPVFERSADKISAFCIYLWEFPSCMCLGELTKLVQLGSIFLVFLLFTRDSFKFAWVKLFVSVNEPLFWLKLLVRHVDRLSCKWCVVCSPPNAVFSAPSYCGGCTSDADGTSGQT